MAGRPALVRRPGVAARSTSPPGRARETPEFMGKPHRLAVTADAPFMAIAFGAWEGMILDEVAWRAAPPTIRRRGFRDRGRAGPRLAAAHAGQTVAVVTHVLPALGPGPARLWAGHNALWHLEGLREP